MLHPKDYFSSHDGITCAGVHLLIDLWDADRLDDLAHIEAALRETAKVARATVLHGHFHVFTPYGGITGVLLLSESHISIHTWPERRFASIDVFMCSGCDPRDGLPALKNAFATSNMVVEEIRRGRIN